MKFWFVLIAFITLGFLASCKKYEEGPALSLRSKKNRLENKWKYEKIFVDGEETVLTFEDQKLRLTFDKEGLAVKEVANASGPASYVGRWYWQDDKEKIKIIFDYSYFGNPVHEELQYRILKLKNQELWFEEIKPNGDTIEYHFIPE